jgi:peptidoglycan/LPS O-acetylase OafA/YrhL
MSRSPALTYRPDIDGLRAIAVIIVVGFHAWPRAFSGGFIGVDVFFVISGYLISTLVLKGLTEKKFSFADFYIRRIKRIFPALMLVLATCAVLGWFILWAQFYAQLGKHIVAAGFFVLNFVLWGEAGYFDTDAIYKPLLHLWSLSIEEQFYLVWPAVLLLVFKRAYNVAVVTLLIAVVSFLLNVALVKAHPAAAFFLPFTRVWELMLGSLLASLELMPGWVSAVAATKTPRVRLAREIAGWGGAAMIAVAFVMLSPRKAFPGWWALLPTLGTVLIIVAGMGAAFNRRVLAWQPMVFIGLISYPLYLWHWPLLSFARLTSFDDPPRWEREVLVYGGLVVLSFILAWLTYKLLEHPIRSSRRMAQPAVALVAVAIVIGAVGFSIDRFGGLPSRAADAAGFFQSDTDQSFLNAFYDHAVSCGPVNGNPAVSYLCKSAPAAQWKIAVFGDSHAHVLYPGLVEALPAAGENFIFLRACAFPLVGLIESNRPFNGYCPASTSEQQVAYLAGINSLETVILVFRGPIYLLGKGFGSGPAEREHDVVLEAADSAQRGLTQAQLFSFGVSGAIDVFERAHKRVVMVLDVPELSFDITDCIFDKPFHPRLADCRIPRSAVEARQQQYRAAIAALHSRHPNMAVFDTLPLFCDEQFCYGIKDHHVFYQDSNHIGVYGIKLIGANLAKFLEVNGLVKSR